MGDNADSHELLSVVAAVHHEGVGETLNDWALGLAETLGSITTSGVGDVDWGADLDVIAGESYVSRRSWVHVLRSFALRGYCSIFSSLVDPPALKFSQVCPK